MNEWELCNNEMRNCDSNSNTFELYYVVCVVFMVLFDATKIILIKHNFKQWLVK